MLSSQDWGPLSKCSRQLRHFVQTFAIAITVHQLSAVSNVVRDKWSQLAVIKVLSRANLTFSQTFCLPKSSNFELIASLDSWQPRHKSKDGSIESQTLEGVADLWRGRHSSSVLLVSPTAHKDNSSQHKSIAAAFANLRKAEWPAYGLTASATDLSTPNTFKMILAQLAHFDWPCLQCLNLSNNRLDCAAMEQLVRISWPNLRRLDLGKNQLDGAAMTVFMEGNWLALEELILDENTGLCAAGIASISKAKCKNLTELSLRKVKLDMESVIAVRLMNTRLKSLYLGSTDITAAALSELTSVSWPFLQHLSLFGNRLTADAIVKLALADLHFPRLDCLDLGGNKLDAAAACVLAQCQWPRLQHLALNHNQLDNAAMIFLAKGSWPALGSLVLWGNDINNEVARQVSLRQWPRLYDLALNKLTCAGPFGASLKESCTSTSEGTY